MGKHGRTCVAFEHSSQDYHGVASCALAWGCDYTRDWSGGKTYIRKTQYTGHATSQCYVNSIQHSGDRLDNPIFNGGGFIGSVTGSECAAKCDDPSNKDTRAWRLSIRVKITMLWQVVRWHGAVTTLEIGREEKPTSGIVEHLLRWKKKTSFKLDLVFFKTNEKCKSTALWLYKLNFISLLDASLKWHFFG